MFGGNVGLLSRDTSENLARRFQAAQLQQEQEAACHIKGECNFFQLFYSFICFWVRKCYVLFVF